MFLSNKTKKTKNCFESFNTEENGFNTFNRLFQRKRYCKKGESGLKRLKSDAQFNFMCETLEKVLFLTKNTAKTPAQFQN